MLADLADAVDVVRLLHRAVIPLRVLIHRREEINLHDDAALVCLGEEVLEPAEEHLVPAGQVEAGAAIDVTGRAASSPRTDQPA